MLFTTHEPVRASPGLFLVLVNKVYRLREASGVCLSVPSNQSAALAVVGGVWPIRAQLWLSWAGSGHSVTLTSSVRSGYRNGGTSREDGGKVSVEAEEQMRILYLSYPHL